MEEFQNESIDGQRPRGRSRKKGNREAADRVSHKKKPFFAQRKKTGEMPSGYMTETEAKETKVREKEVKETEAKQTEAKQTEAKQKEVKEAKVNEVKVNEAQDFGRRRRIMITAAAAAGIVIAAAGVAYGIMGQKYKKVFYPNTIVNGIDVSGRTPEQAKEMIAAGIKGYILKINTRTGEEQIAGSDIDLHPEYDDSLEYILNGQSTILWGKSLMKEVSYTISAMTAYDQEKLNSAVNGLSCMDPERMEAPKDAVLSDYIDGVGYQIIPEEQGCSLDSERVMQGIAEAIVNLQPELSLEEMDAYKKPQITSEDEELNKRLASLNQYAQMTVTYLFGSRREVLDGSTIHRWLSFDGQGNIQVDEAQIAEYVQQLGKKYNTAYQSKQLKTSYGETVTITKGNYGWRINQNAEAAALAEIIRSGQGQEREPVYLQKAASHEGPDYGSTYVEINLTAQHLYFYKNGELLVESDFVSGNEARGFSTPAGAYPLTYKQRNATLKGEGYATPVSYWMPFNGGIGMHDASWRSTFGGSIYKTNGSHGCINLPTSVAKKIYENIEAGMPVLCYHLGGTEAKASAKAPSTSKPAQPETTAAPETAAQETAPAPAEKPSVPQTAPAAQSGAAVPESTPAAGGNPSSAGAAPSVPENPAGQQQSSPGQSAQGPGQSSGTNPAGSSQGSGGTSAQPNTSSGGPGAQQTPQGGASAGPGAGAAGPSGSSAGVQTQEVPGGQVQTSPTPGGGASAGPGGQAVQPGPGSAGGPGM